MRLISKENSIAKTPVTDNEWQRKSDTERVKLIQNFLSQEPEYNEYEVINAEKDGQIILKIQKSIPANIRGILLLDLEKELKKKIDSGLTIWLEPVGDKSKLRNLRGIKIKTV